VKFSHRERRHLLYPGATAIRIVASVSCADRQECLSYISKSAIPGRLLRGEWSPIPGQGPVPARAGRIA